MECVIISNFYWKDLQLTKVEKIICVSVLHKQFCVLGFQLSRLEEHSS